MFVESTETHILHQLVRVNSSTVGSGPIKLGNRVKKYLTFSEVDLRDGVAVSYGINNYNKDGYLIGAEYGVAIYDATESTLTRDPSCIPLSGHAEVFIGPPLTSLNNEA